LSRAVDCLTVVRDEVAFVERILTHPQPLTDLDRAALAQAFRCASHALSGAAKLTRRTRHRLTNRGSASHVD
jgi:hypothetical protein